MNTLIGPACWSMPYTNDCESECMKYHSEESYNTGKTHNNSAPTVFKDITIPDDLIRYLCDDTRRLSNSEYIYHYTTISSVIKIIRSESWHLTNAVNMNDKLEYQNGDKARWPNIFFSSFMTEDRESIGMWSMYAQPWEKGIKIAIPSNVARKWVRGITKLDEISILNYTPTGKTVSINPYELSLASVVYSNTDSLTKNDTVEKLCWSNVFNTNLKNAAHMHALTGYVKDMAWSYEKEIRIRAEFDNTNGFQRVAIKLPDEVINSMIITASPLFEGNLLDELQKETQRQLNTDSSLFKGRLNIETICQSCEFKKTIMTH